jgi:hypothetical protein
MKDHTTDEGWRIFEGLKYAGWHLSGYKLDNLTHIPDILTTHNPGVVFVQDPREWDLRPRDFRDPNARFTDVYRLATQCDLFVVTLIKDAQQRPSYHCHWVQQMGAHAVVCYYHPRIVCHLAPYIRPQHIIRTWHSLEPAWVPLYRHDNRLGCVISGALSGAYPLRQRMFDAARRAQLLRTATLPHPGYHRHGCNTPEYMKQLSQYKVAMCTSSIYGYALRKIIEATACGCVVITDLPSDEIMPEIDGNLKRVSPDVGTGEMNAVINEHIKHYDRDKQYHYAQLAKQWYDWRAVGMRLAGDIENMRRGYNVNVPCIHQPPGDS